MNPSIGTPIYLASAGDNQAVFPIKCVLHRIIVGKDVASGLIEVSDHLTDGDGNKKVHLESSTLKGTYECGIVFEKGITVDLANQTNVTFVVSPIN